MNPATIDNGDIAGFKTVMSICLSGRMLTCVLISVIISILFWNLYLLCMFSVI